MIRSAPRPINMARLCSLPLLLVSLAIPARAEPAACEGPAAMGISRTIEIDGAGGGVYGSLSARANRPGILAKKEVALTFDDGPMPWITKSILDTLDKACVKATFFSVGRMAIAYPATVRDVVARGHTLGTHTYSHPFNMPRMKKEKAEDEIEQGFAAVAAAAGGPIAPFFRFTGLADSAALVDYLGTRRMAAFTVDAVSNDSYIGDAAQLTKRTIAEVEANKGGIILFHDIKVSTAKALPGILSELKARGYSVVHFVPKAPAEPNLDLMAAYAQKVTKLVAQAESGAKKQLPFYGAIGPEKAAVTKGELRPTAAANPAPAADPNAPVAGTTLQPPQALKGGLDLTSRPRSDQHPASSAFASGFPADTHGPSTAAVTYKGGIWEAMESWAGSLSPSVQDTAQRKK